MIKYFTENVIPVIAVFRRTSLFSIASSTKEGEFDRATRLEDTMLYLLKSSTGGLKQGDASPSTPEDKSDIHRNVKENLSKSRFLGVITCTKGGHSDKRYQER